MDKYFSVLPARLEHRRIWALRPYFEKAGVPSPRSVQVVVMSSPFGTGPVLLLVRIHGDRRDGEYPAAGHWDWEVDTWLVSLGAGAIDHANESLRFAVRMQHAYRYLLAEMGDGHFNDTLASALRDSPFFSHPVSGPMIESLCSRRGRDGSIPGRMDSVDNVIRYLARELVDDLGYPRRDAEEILAGAVAQYLDRRFLLTERRRGP